jgi:ABC-type sugar transport system ATPase subunit
MVIEAPTASLEEQRRVTGEFSLFSARGICKSFGAVHVLTDVDLDVPAGQVTALVGDNGAGKTVLIKCFAGIAVLMISHKMPDVFRTADRIAVLYMGRLVAARPTSQFDTQTVVSLMTWGTAVDRDAVEV